MLQNIKKTFFILGFFIAILNVYSQKGRKYVLASGSRGGNYYKTGKFIVKKFNDIATDSVAQFLFIESKGSIDNIELLKKNYADFAIVQRNVLLSSLYDATNGINNIEVITPLFEEKLLIYYRQKKAISIKELKEYLYTNKLRIGFTSKESYSYELYNIIFKYLGINQANVIEKENDYNSLIADYQKDSLDIVISFSLPIRKLQAIDNSSLVYFEKEEIGLLEDRIPNLFSTEIDVDENHKTLGSWAFLIGVKNKLNELEPIAQDLFSSLNLPDDHFIGKKINESINSFKSNKKRNKRFIKGIPLTVFLEKELNYYPIDTSDIVSFFGIVLFLALILYLLNKKHLLPHISYLFLWHRYKHVIIGVLSLGGLYFLSVIVLQKSEQNFFVDVGIKSQLLNLSKNDLHFWLFIRNLTGIDNDIHPLSTSGKLVLSFVSYLLWIGTILIALSEYLAYQISKKRKQGLMKITFENHIVIIGWNDTTNSFVKDTIEAAKNFNGQKEKLVCIVPNPEQIIDKYKTLSKLQSERKLHFVKGETRDRVTLNRANIHKAKTVVLLAEDSSQKADEKTLLRALAITRFCRQKAIDKEKTVAKDTSFVKTYEVGHYIDEIYIIAEINDLQFKNDLMDADVNEVIVSAIYAKGVVTQSILNHGISKVVDELLQFNEYNEFYVVDLALQRNAHLRDKTYDELLLPLRKEKILLIAIKVVYRNREDDKEIIDENEIAKLLHQEGLKRQIIVNPITDEEIARKTDGDDQLIVFSTDRKALIKQLQEVKFTN